VEKDRIRDFAPHRGAFAVAANSAAFVSRMVRLFPSEADAVAALFPAKKDHFRLATDRSGRCTLLGQTGCRLPVEARPYHCRLFPIWFSAGQATVLATPNCLALREATSMARLLDSLDMNLLRARDLHGRLRLAWGLPPREGMPSVPKAFARYPR
jgi:Fe-S-cluster containining protein